MKRLIFDTANILFRVAAANTKFNSGTPEEKAGLAMHIALQSLNSFYKKFKPDEIAMTFEGKKNWRKTYTKSSECKSGKIYKANRIYDSSMEPFFELIKDFEDLARNHTSLVCLSNPLLEGDDLIAGYVQKFAHTEDEIYVISGDKDFVQLLKSPNIHLINPDKGKERKVEEVCGVDDASYFMFEKCFRGDKGDNVFPAYPRIFKKRLLKAYSDEYELTQLLNESVKFKDPETGEETNHLVEDLFLENNLLMNLECQPDDIKKVINETLDYELEHHGKFSHFQFTKFCGKFGLVQVAENAQMFADMFSTTGKTHNKQKTEMINEKKQLIEF